jgi:hypothetical protein
MKIHIELLGYKNKTLIERSYSIESARLADLSQIVDEMVIDSKSINNKKEIK